MMKFPSVVRMGRCALLAALVVAPAAISSASQAADPVPSNDAPVTPEALVSLYVADHAPMRTNTAFARDWTAAMKCQAWTRLSDDEFRAVPFLKAGAAELSGDKSQPPGTYTARFKRYFGNYDTTRQAFALTTFNPGAILTIPIKDYTGENTFGRFDHGCAPTSGLFPLQFDIAIDNPSVANGISMPPDQAEAFARSRTNAAGTRAVGVVVVVKMRLAIVSERPAQGVVKGMVVSMAGHITDVTVEDDTDRHPVLHRVSAEKMRAGDAEAALMREDAQREASAKLVTNATLAEQLKAELAGAHVGTEPTRVRVGLSWDRRDGVPGQYTFALLPSTRLRVTDTSLRFDNTAEVAALSPNSALLPVLAGPGTEETYITYVPVGAFDDPLKEERTVVGHVLSVDNVAVVNGVRRFVSTPTSSSAVPLKAAMPDKRLAADFEVAGFRTGMSPTEVAKVAKEQLNQTLMFDEAKGTMSSSPDQCTLASVPHGEKPTFGLRCLTATFLKVAPGTRWTLVRFQLQQTAAKDQLKATLAAVRAKYGPEDLSANYTSISGLNGGRGTPAGALGWGPRLTDIRQPESYAPFPLHPLELLCEFADDVMVLRFVVTDWAAMQAETVAKADARAAETKRAGDAAAPKF